MTYSCKPANKDIFFFDREDLQRISDPENISLGLACFKENRVLEIDQDETRLWAEVEDETLSPVPLDVMVELDHENNLHFSCDCNQSEDGLCCHQVAAMYAYADQRQETDGLLTAFDTAIKERIKRGRSEVNVVAESGQPWFGSWRASSINAIFPRSYRVVIRNLHKRRNYCSCPDFASNQLGTCKHIEAALHKIKKHPEYQDFKDKPAPFPYIYLDQETGSDIRLHPVPGIDTELQRLLDDYFSKDGKFKGRIPEDFFSFVELTENRSDIHIGDDAVDWARHKASEISHRLRAAEIRQEIKNGRGRIQGIKVKLYPYQIEGVAFLAGTGRALLADDMGLGKTIQAISAATWLKFNQGIEKILVVCPASLKQQWAREIAKFTDLPSQVVGGPPEKRHFQYRRQVNFFIINYELILRDLSVINKNLCPDLIIIDEAQRIKNWRTKISSAIKLIPSRYAFVLTGTPLENKLEDLYSLMQVINPRILGPLWRYMIDFHVLDERGKILGYRNLSLLRKRLEPVMLRRDRILVRDQLPERITQRLDVGMTTKQVELHDAAMNNAGQLAQIGKKRPLTPSEQNRLIAALQQARMACNSAGLVDKETEGSPKIDELANILDEMCIQGGRKAVVFSQWEMMTRMVEQKLRKMGLGYVRLHGGVPTAKRGELMDRFRNDVSVQVFVSTDAGGVGLNLQSGSILINLDVPWNPAVLEQRNARIHRLGQKEKVQIITMVAANSYEEQVLGMVNTKQHLFDNVVKDDASEDVIGVSKKLVEALVEDLAKKNEPSASDELIPELETEDHVVKDRKPKLEDTSHAETIRYCIDELQKGLGPRIERILGAKGGLIAVLDQVDSEAEKLAVDLSEKMPVAIIDIISLNGLNRLGTGSPLADAHTWYESSENEEKSALSRLESMSIEKLNAARLLIEQKMPDSALDLLLSALLAKSAAMAGLDTAPTPSSAAVWIYSDALPKGILNPAEANMIMQVIGLMQAENVPDELITGLFKEVNYFITYA